MREARSLGLLISVAVPLLQLQTTTTWADEPGNPGRFTHIYAFGDSFSDNGVKLKLSTLAVAAGVQNAKVKPDPNLYYQGRYSDGMVAVEFLAKDLHTELTDYAVGGAMSGDQNYDAWMDDYTATGIQAQVASFEHDLAGGRADPKALYMIEISANDYFKFVDFSQPGVLFVGSTTPATLVEIADRAAENTRLAIGRLSGIGAHDFLVSLSFYLKGPYVLSAGQSQKVDEFARQYNTRLKGVLSELQARHDVWINLFDAGAKIQEIIDSPSVYGITNSTDACETTFPVPKPPCGHPDSYLFWDEYHPTRHAHELLGSMMAQSLLEGGSRRQP